MKKILFVCLFAVIFPSLIYAKGVSNRNSFSHFKLIPTPQEMIVSNQSAWNYKDLGTIKITDLRQGKSSVSKDKIDFNSTILGPILKNIPFETNPKSKQKVLKLELTNLDLKCSQQNSDEKIREEQYRLVINKKGALIQANSTVGLFYGCATLEQLMEDSKQYNVPIPCLEIKDYPTLEFRSIHIDNKHHVDHIDVYYELIDKLASYKINSIIWEIEDKLGYKRRPKIAAPNAISIEEMRALSEYAYNRNIVISPLINSLGHASYIIKNYPELRESDTSIRDLCPSNPKTYELLYDLYLDAFEAMPYSKYLHIGGDEVSTIGTGPKCKKRNLSKFELQVDWINTISDFAESIDKKIIIWDDMLLKYGEVWNIINARNLSEEQVEEKWNSSRLIKSGDELVAKFPKSCTYMRWHYFDPLTPGHNKILEWYKNSGLNVIGATSAAAGDSPYLPRNNSRIKYIKSFCNIASENSLSGVLATSWDDGSPHIQTVIRGYIAHAEYCWNPKSKSIDKFMIAHAQREFGLDSLPFLRKLEDVYSFFDGALVDKGRRNPAWGIKNFKSISLPNKYYPGKWSRKYKERIKSAEELDKLYYEIRDEIDDAINQSSKNKYTLRIYEQLNELQHFPIKLILALNLYDKSLLISSPEKQVEAKNNLKKVCDSFYVMKTNLERVYGESRELVQPHNYVQDNNPHNHLSAKTMNFDWMYYFELPVLKQIETWFCSD